LVAWISGWDFSGQITGGEMKEFPHLLKWVERIATVSDFYMKRGVELMIIASWCPEGLREGILILVNG
jgi:hypothetical protein